MGLDWFKLVTVLRRYRPSDSRLGDFERDPGPSVTITFAPLFSLSIGQCPTTHAWPPMMPALDFFACIPVAVDLSDSSMIKITYAQDAPSWRIRKTVGDLADLPAGIRAERRA